MSNELRIKRGLEANRSGITPAAGELIYTTDNKRVFIGDGSTAGGIPVGGFVTISDTAPVSPSVGDLWWDSEYGTLNIFYQDVDSSQWVEISATGGTIETPATAGGEAYTVITTTYTAVAGDYILANTTGGAFTITLPASPTAGDTINIIDGFTQFSANNLTLARNGSTIEGLSSDIIVDVNDAKLKIIYNGTTWRIM
jgi:hypothetical protein